MIRGTTPTHKFTLPNDASEYSNILITYRQNGDTTIEKRLSDLDVKDNIVSLRLTQEETFLFDEGTAFIQLKVLTTDGIAMDSAVYSIPVTSSLSDYVFTNEGDVTVVLTYEITDDSHFFKIVTGTNPTIYYIPKGVQPNTITDAFLIIKQQGRTIIEKTLSDAHIVNGKLSWTLSQEDTLSLKPFIKATMSCVWKQIDGIRGESPLVVCDVYKSSKNEVI